MIDVTRGVRIPTDLDADFCLTVADPSGEYDVMYLLDEGTPIGVHEVYHEGQWYRVTCSVEAIPDPEEGEAVS